MQKIIYKNDEGGVSIIHPSAQILEHVNIEDIAKKDVPEGVAYYIVEEEDIPTDHTFRAAWELDVEATPSGVGGEEDTFSQEIIEKIKEAQNDYN